MKYQKSYDVFIQNFIRIFLVPKPPEIIHTTLQSEKIINFNEQLVLYCKFSGEPKPILKWYKVTQFEPLAITAK